MDPSEIVQALTLEPHPEGGFYRETFRSDVLVMTERGSRPAATAILFLVTAGHASRFHRLASDEVWLHHGGSAVELAILLPDGRVERETLTRAEDALASEAFTPQALVPGGAWQAARLLRDDEDAWALLSCVVTPGFDFADFELADAASLRFAYPDADDLIAALT